VTATCIILNGTSSSGKSSIAAALQRLWPEPLQVSGLDTFLSLQSLPFFGFGGHVAPGFSWLPANQDGQPAFDIDIGPAGIAMIRATHAYWAACAAGGLDQVIDDVWLVPGQPTWLRDALHAATTFWVGVRCPLAVTERRERDRGDRIVGTARGQHPVVHSFRAYDIEVDTSVSSPQKCAEAILAALPVSPGRTGRGS
jgi:chloramphenicol 3-O phosphotransferase